jgi:UDP-N-acetylmuramoylalanine--D-glutamate ligase
LIGLGETGRSVINFLNSIDVDVIAMDTREKLPCVDTVLSKILVLIKGRIDHSYLESSEMIVLSPGVSKADLGCDILRRYGSKVIGDIELFARFCRSPIIAITGTNGKTTVATLVSRMLESTGLKILIGGNIGPPALDLLTKPRPDLFVLELSSFQLETTSSLSPSVAAIINVSPDHLDRYESFDSYFAAKRRILSNAATGVLNKDDEVLNNVEFSGKRIWFTLNRPENDEYEVTHVDGKNYLSTRDRSYVELDSLSLMGEHNVANALAALAICGCFIDITKDLAQSSHYFRGKNGLFCLLSAPKFYLKLCRRTVAFLWCPLRSRQRQLNLKN